MAKSISFPLTKVYVVEGKVIHKLSIPPCGFTGYDHWLWLDICFSYRLPVGTRFKIIFKIVFNVWHISRFQAIISQQCVLLWVLQEQAYCAVWHFAGGLLTSQQDWRTTAWAAREWRDIQRVKSQAKGYTAINIFQKISYCADMNQASLKALKYWFWLMALGLFCNREPVFSNMINVEEKVASVSSHLLYYIPTESA